MGLPWVLVQMSILLSFKIADVTVLHVLQADLRLIEEPKIWNTQAGKHDATFYREAVETNTLLWRGFTNIYQYPLPFCWVLFRTNIAVMETGLKPVRRQFGAYLFVYQLIEKKYSTSTIK